MPWDKTFPCMPNLWPLWHWPWPKSAFRFQNLRLGFEKSSQLVYLFSYTLSDFKNATVGFYFVSKKLIDHTTPIFISCMVYHSYTTCQNFKKIYLLVFEKKWFNKKRFKTSFHIYSLINWLITFFVFLDLWFFGGISTWKRISNQTFEKLLVLSIRRRCYVCFNENGSYKRS